MEKGTALADEGTKQGRFAQVAGKMPLRNTLLRIERVLYAYCSAECETPMGQVS
jgi:hypothetical protein